LTTSIHPVKEDTSRTMKKLVQALAVISHTEVDNMALRMQKRSELHQLILYATSKSLGY